ncbi:MAG: hypothetical protein KJ968_04130 [Nanoarchaeota archaeon]|nr:hypothetical protein [Nanoarchaeota archaeon]
MSKITKETKKEVNANSPLEKRGLELTERSHLTSDIEKAISSYSEETQANKRAMESKKIKKFFFKEFFDRISYGFGSQQFINILFSQTGASYFVIGTINGLRVVLSVIIASFLDEYSKVRQISKRFIGITGIIFGLSFIFMAMARFLHSVPLFALALLIGSIGAVSYGELYQNMFKYALKKERSYLLRNIAQYGLMITGASILLAGFLMDKFPAIGTPISLFGFKFRIFGYLIAFEIAAISSIISGYVLSFIKEKQVKFIEKRTPLTQLKIQFNNIKDNLFVFVKNKVILILFVASIITGFVQTLGNSYYGIYIYETFKYGYFRGFTNVAVIFLIAIMTSFFAPFIVRKNAREYGKFPMLVFGTLLMAIMPLTYYYNPNLVSISIGTLIGFIGAAIVGVSHGLLTIDIMPENQRKAYFSTYSLLIIIPYLIIIPLGAYAAQVYGLRALFLLLGLILAFIVVPLYFLIIVMHKKEKI